MHTKNITGYQKSLIAQQECYRAEIKVIVVYQFDHSKHPS